MTYRVQYGWSVYKDFAERAEARKFAIAVSRQPVTDPLIRTVYLLGEVTNAPRPVLATYKREVRPSRTPV